MPRLWRIGGGLFAAGLLLVGVVQVVVLISHQRRTVEEAYPAAALDAVEVHNLSGGRVEVVGVDGDEVRLVAVIDDGLRSTGHEARVEDRRLVVRSSCPILFSAHCSVTYRLEVPAAMAVTVRDDAGSIAISDVDGNVSVRTDAGGVDLARIGGVVQAHSDAGGVDAVGLTSAQVTADSDAGRVSLDFASAPSSVVASSDAGSVDIVLPNTGERYNVSADSDAGGVTTAVETSPSSDRTIVATSDAGSVTVRYGTSG